MRLLITGGAGFLGARIALRAAALGHEVLAVGRSEHPERLDPELRESVQYQALDATFPGVLREATLRAKPDVLVHAAAPGVLREERISERDLLRLNVAMATELAKAADAVGAVVWIGSCFEYSPSREPMADDSPLAPESAYGKAKLEAWKIFAAKAPSLKRVAALRPFHLYGPGEPLRRFAPSALLAPLGLAANRFGNPAAIRDFVYVDDAANAVLLAAKALHRGEESGGSNANIATGRPTALRDFAEIASRVAGRPGFVHRFEGAPPLKGYDPDYLVARCIRAKSMFGWEAHTSIEQGLRATLESMKPHLSHGDRARSLA